MTPMRLALAFLLLFQLFVPAHAQPTGGYQTAASEAILIDVDTGATLFEKNSDRLFAPASMSKIMTLAVIFKKLKAGEITMDTEFPVSLYAWRNGGAPSRTSSMFVPLNQSAKVSDLIQGIAVQNANDACIAVAEGISGTEDAFAKLLTEEARALGLQKSTFGNSTGLPHPGNQMTARELAALSLHVIKTYPDWYPFFAQKEFKYRTFTFRNHNPLLSTNVAADGLKPGFTEGVGYSIAASAVRDGRRLVLVMNGLESERDRREEAQKMLNWGFVNFKAFKVFEKDEVVGEVRVWGGQKWTLPVKAKEDVLVLLPVNAKDQRIRAQIAYQGPVKPPVKEGDKVAEVRITSEAGTSNSAPLYAAVDLEAGSMVSKGIDSLLLSVNAYVSQAVTKYLKKPHAQPVNTAAPAISPKS